MTVIEWIILFFSLASLVFGIYLLFKIAYKPNIWLSVLFFTFSYQLFYSVLYWSEFSEFLLIQLDFSHLFPMAVYGPLFYLYLQSLIKPRKLRLKDMFHCIPVITFFILYWGYYSLSFIEKLNAIDSKNINDHIIVIPRFDWILCFIMLIYAISSYRIFLNKMNKDIDLIIWLKAIIISFSIFVAGYYTYYILLYFQLITTEMDYFITFIMISFISLAVYFGSEYPNVFNGKPIGKVIPFVKYQRTGLSDSFSIELKDKLENFMENEKPFLENTLRLNDLADALNISRNHMSQVINTHFGLSFFDYVNMYRVKESIRILLEEDLTLSISDIAYQSGFNNRVSFYKSFKRVTGTTPLEFKQKTNKAS